MANKQCIIFDIEVKCRGMNIPTTHRAELFQRIEISLPLLILPDMDSPHLRLMLLACNLTNWAHLSMKMETKQITRQQLITCLARTEHMSKFIHHEMHLIICHSEPIHILSFQCRRL